MLEGPGAIEAGRLSRRRLPDGQPGPGEVRIEVEACAVCRTDLQIAAGDLGAHRLPIVPGHQVVGRVAEVGPGVTSYAPGTRVGVGWMASACGRCRFCQEGRENLCPDATFTGWDRDGGYATQMLALADFVQPLPEGRAAVELAPLLCGGIIGFRALRQTGLSSGQRLGLFGFGASALLVLQVARHQGLEVHVVSRDPGSRDRARALGAAWVGGAGERPPSPLQGAITFAPAGSVVIEALRALDRGGTCVVNAIHLDGVPAFPYPDLYWERRLMSVANFTREDGRELLELAQRIPIQTRFQTLPLWEAASALERVQSDRVDGALVLVP